MGKNIGLEVPNRITPGKDAFNIRPRKLADWINKLPRANLGETARQIFTVLQQTNQLAYPYQDRIRFLETLREPLEYVTRSMKKHFVGISLPLPEKSQKIATITKELYASMACAYEIALEDMLANNLMIFDKKSLAMLTHRSISYIGQNFLASYQSYSPFSDQLWGELHKLYLFAEKRKILKSKIVDYQHVYIDRTTVATEYARLLLLSLASPYHLRQGEVGKVYDSLERWITQPVIRPLTQQDTNSGHFIDNLGANQGPMALSLAKADATHNLSLLRMIDTQVLSQKLEHEIKSSEDVGGTTLSGIESARPDISHDLMQRLLIAWAMASKRHFPRTNKNEEVKITVGLSAAHQFITKKAQPQAFGNGTVTNTYANRAHFESTEIKLNAKDPTATSDDVWGMIYPTQFKGLETLVENELSLTERGLISPVPNMSENEAEHYQMDNWAIINESVKGLMIHNKDEFKNKAQVGELVSLRRAVNGQANKWSIGVIRWLKFNHDKSLQMGIEIINPNAAAIGIRPAGNKNAPMQRTLMLPELKNLKQPASLITSPVPWRVGNKITLNMLGKEIPATLTKSVQNTGLFAQFQFEITPQTKQTAISETADIEQDFSNVWSTI